MDMAMMKQILLPSDESIDAGVVFRQGPREAWTMHCPIGPSAVAIVVWGFHQLGVDLACGAVRQPGPLERNRYPTPKRLQRETWTIRPGVVCQ